MNRVQIINGGLTEEIFSKAYPELNKFIMESGDVVESRNGVTREILNFKTEILNPYYRCVGGYGRDINVFFLLAEALWIFTGKKDVAFLNIFNGNMSNFSDDGEVFHAPYGFRLRNWGLSSSDKFTEENKHSSTGFDQIAKSLEMLKNNPLDRRVVLSIWNPDLDLGTDGKDLPCNDLVMFKIRNGKLHTTIANRSNDLHWGLPTNIFQFGFLSEVMSAILGIELGTQTHNSQSLHVYTENNIAWTMYENYNMTSEKVELYDLTTPIKMDFKFKSEYVDYRLSMVDLYFNQIIANLTNEDYPQDFDRDLANFSQYFKLTYDLLRIYRTYKKSDKNDEVRRDLLQRIALNPIGVHEDKPVDLSYLGMNFLASKLKDKSGLSGALGKL